MRKISDTGNLRMGNSLKAFLKRDQKTIFLTRYEIKEIKKRDKTKKVRMVTQV